MISATSPSPTRCGCGASATRASSRAPPSPGKPPLCSRTARRRGCSTPQSSHPASRGPTPTLPCLRGREGPRRQRLGGGGLLGRGEWRLSLPHILHQLLHLRRRRGEAELGAAPQHIVGAARPFAVDEPTQLGLAEALPKAAAERRFARRPRM